jgi:UDP-N-acetylglucosamine 2-epimerase (non-hydrolysing)
MQVDVSVVAGTRPEAIKLAPVVFALRERELSVRLVASGQHAGLLDDALAAFGLSADVNLQAMAAKPDLPALTARLIERLAAELAEHPPRMVVVQGDTTTALAGALAAFYARIPCAHVEAGLRSGRRDAPWPEELNRQLVDRLCTRLYAPTSGARGAMIAEGLSGASILLTGQTGVDAALWMASRATDPPKEYRTMAAGPVVYVTLHRRENQAGGIADVLRGVCAALDAAPGATAVVSRHPNPDVRRVVDSIKHERMWVFDPLPYRDSIWMMAHAAVIVTDSGGIQEEAPSFGTPVLVARDVTERPEGLQAGFLRLVGTDSATVAAALKEALADTGGRARLKAQPNPYGDGRASQRIADDIAGLLK